MNFATYLSALGINVTADTVARWLALIPILAIELGSSLSMILLGSLNSGADSAASNISSLARPKETSPGSTMTQRVIDHQSRNISESPRVTGLERLIAASQIPLHRVETSWRTNCGAP
jgi:hypothetical protein